MATLVTGGAGYIGSHMVCELIDRGETVVVVDNLSTGFAWAVQPGATLARGDVADELRIARLIKDHDVTAIIHFAGSIVVPDSIRDPLGYYHNNTVKSRALIAAAIAGGVKHFIFSSTAAVYGNPLESPVSELAAPAPISPYGTSKLMTEIMLRDAAAAHDISFVALRYFNVAGGDPKGRTGQSTPRATHLIKVAVQAAIGQRDGLDLFGTDYATPDGTCIRDYIHVSDLVRAHSAALDFLRAGGASAICNCGYGKGYSVRDVIASVKRVSGTNFPVREVARREGDPASIIAANERIKSLLGWRPELDDLDTIVGHALAWEQALPARMRG